MNRMLKAAAAAAAVGGGFGSAGCMHSDRPSLQDRYAGKVDPCWPERYNSVARAEVLSPFAIHATNGLIVDHTLTNYHFEPGTDKLNPAGLEKLDYLSRRRPAPESKLYLQTARDVAFDPAAPDKMAGGRADLDGRRTASIQRYLSASTAGRPVAFDVQVIDPPDLTFSAQGPANAARGYPFRFQSGIGSGVSSNNVQAPSASSVNINTGGGGTSTGGNTGGGSAGGSSGGSGAAGGTGGTGR